MTFCPGSTLALRREPLRVLAALPIAPPELDTRAVPLLQCPMPKQLLF